MNALQAIVERALPGARVLGSRALAGGVSATTTALEVEHDGAVRRLVVRRIGAPTLAANPHAASQEFAVRRAVAAAGIPTATPLAWSAEPWPHLLLDYVEGHTTLDASATLAGLEPMADALARIHTLELEALGPLPSFAAEVEGKLAQVPARLDARAQEPRVRAALAAAWPLTPRNRSVALHGDFWPGNLLWREGALVAVLDWEDAAQGDPLADLAIARLDLTFVAGAEAASAFTARYASRVAVDLEQLPVWDLFAALRPAGHFEEWAAVMPEIGRPDLDLERMTSLHAAFVERALRAT